MRVLMLGLLHTSNNVSKSHVTGAGHLIEPIIVLEDWLAKIWDKEVFFCVKRLLTGIQPHENQKNFVIFETL